MTVIGEACEDRRCWTDFSAEEVIPRNGSRFDLSLDFYIHICVGMYVISFFLLLQQVVDEADEDTDRCDKKEEKRDAEISQERRS